MMNREHSAQIKGWCPGALRPMASGDGLVVRVRPRAGLVSAIQARGLALAAQTYGNGQIDITNRANLQLRGVTEAGYEELLDELGRLELLDSDSDSEAKRNIIITPFREDGECAQAFAHELEAALGTLPKLSGKFGFAIDTGYTRCLNEVSADIRLEQSEEGSLMVRADGAAFGEAVSMDNAVVTIIALARWFVETAGLEGNSGRMAAHIAKGNLPPNASSKPVPTAARPRPGLCRDGALVGFSFGQMQAQTLHALADLGPLRVTPWRMLLVGGLLQMPNLPELITRDDDPLQAVTACTGQPGCLQAKAGTRDLAKKLASFVPSGAHLHVSGCTKGCAHPGPTHLTLVANNDGFDLVIGGNAMATPSQRGLSTEWLLAHPEILSGAL